MQPGPTRENPFHNIFATYEAAMKMRAHSLSARNKLTITDPRATEGVHQNAEGMDTWDNTRILTAFMDVQDKAMKAVHAAIPKSETFEGIEAAAEKMNEVLHSIPGEQGRVVTTGAGTSGRLGYAIGTDLAQRLGLGNDQIAFAQAEPPHYKTGTGRDGREDKKWLARSKASKLHLKKNDVVIALAASGSTPYTNEFAQAAREAGAFVIGISNNEESKLFNQSDNKIFLNTGAEAIAGSTRMGAGTSQKSALSLLAECTALSPAGSAPAHISVAPALKRYMAGEDQAMHAVRDAIPAISAAADAMIARLGTEGRNRLKGRIIYTGTDASGRMGYVDGTELGATFDCPDDQVKFAQAEPGHYRIVHDEDIEDNTALAKARVSKLHLTKDDVIIALDTDGNTAYTRAFAAAAQDAGALVIGIAADKAALFTHCDHSIPLAMGSHPANIGTAQKSTLTLLTSLAMVKMPGIYGLHDGIMVNMRKPPCAKLDNRAIKNVRNFTGCDEDTAKQALYDDPITDGRTKDAIFIAQGYDAKDVDEHLTRHNNNLRRALDDIDSLRKPTAPDAIRAAQNTPSELNR